MIGEKIRVVRLTGDIDTLTSPGIEIALREAIRMVPAAMIVDFECVEYMDSAGFQMLYRVCEFAKGKGVKLAIASVCGRVLRAAEIIKFTEYARVYSDLSEAEQALGMGMVT